GGLTVEETNNPEYPDESGGHEGDKNANLSTEDGPFLVANSKYKFITDWTTTGHTGVDVPLTATGPGAKLLTGNYENTYIHDVMAQSLGVSGLAPLNSDTAATTAEVSMPNTGGLDPRWSVLLFVLAAGVLSGVGYILFLDLRARQS
ncbi:MAG: alkaline phosphatase, partial [Rubrobacteraceae bacterium]